MSRAVDRSFPTLNAVRAAGAIMVMLTHVAFNTGEVVQGWTGAVLSRLDFGVTLFFVLSGFLLSRPHFLAIARGEDSPQLGHYLWKRALRILPLYWLVVVVALLADPDNRGTSLAEWVRQLTLTQIYRAGPPASSLTQMWSLATEAAFYALLPGLAVIVSGVGFRARRRSTKVGELPTARILVVLGLLSILGVVWAGLVAWLETDLPMHQWLPGFLPWFASGMAFAAVSADLHARPRNHPFDELGRDLAGCWILATAVFAIACTPIAGPRTLEPATVWDSVFKCVLYTVAGAFFVLPLVFGPEREGKVRRFLAAPIPHYLGEISYGIFAIHMFVLITVMRLLNIEVFTGHFMPVLLIVGAITVVLATLSFYFLERPALRLKNAGPFAPKAATPTARASNVDPWPSG